MKREDSRYVVNRKSKTGRINKKRVAVVATVTAIGVIGVCSIFNSVKNNKRYDYNGEYPNYSTQLEQMMDVNIGDNVEAELDKLQPAIEAIEALESDHSIISEGDNYKKLVDEKSTIQKTALNILKMSIAKEHGVKPSDIETRFDNSGGSWFAVIKDSGSVTISGNRFHLVNSISKIQDLSEEDLLQRSDADDYIEICNSIIKNSGKVAVDMASKAK